MGSQYSPITLLWIPLCCVCLALQASFHLLDAMGRLAVATTIAVLAVVSNISESISDGTIKASDSRISYIGRFMDDTDDNKT